MLSFLPFLLLKRRYSEIVVEYNKESPCERDR